MTTSAQIQANRQNSQQSTGPKTDAGKSTSSANATSHGFTAIDPVLPNEDRDQFNALLGHFKSDYIIETANEQYLVSEMAAARWKLNRLQRMENAMLAALDDPSKILSDPDTAKAFARLDRYRAGLERTYHRCARELRAVQKLQNEANSTQLAERKFEKLVKRMIYAPPPGYEYVPALLPATDNVEPAGTVPTPIPTLVQP